MPPSPSMSNEKPEATLGWSSSQVTMSDVLLGVTLTAGGLEGLGGASYYPLSQHCPRNNINNIQSQFQDWLDLKDDVHKCN